MNNERVDAFASRPRSLTELCGNIHFQGTIKQQLIQGLPEYLRTDAFVYNTAQRSYQQLSTYVAGKYRAAKDVMTLANRVSPGESSRKGQTSTGPRLRDRGVVGLGQWLLRNVRTARGHCGAWLVKFHRSDVQSVAARTLRRCTQVQLEVREREYRVLSAPHVVCSDARAFQSFTGSSCPLWLCGFPWLSGAESSALHRPRRYCRHPLEYERDDG